MNPNRSLILLVPLVSRAVPSLIGSPPRPYSTLDMCFRALKSLRIDEAVRVQLGFMSMRIFYSPSSQSSTVSHNLSPALWCGLAVPVLLQVQLYHGKPWWSCLSSLCVCKPTCGLTCHTMVIFYFSVPEEHCIDSMGPSYHITKYRLDTVERHLLFLKWVPSILPSDEVR